MTRDAALTALVGLAPKAPPCFPGEEAWLDWLAQAVETDRPGTAESPLHFSRHGLVFNRKLSFCDDCSRTYRMEMKSRGRCKPLALLTPEEVAA